MEAVLARPHAVTCLLAALELKSRRVQREVLELLLRVALTPQGTAKLLASCEVLRHAETDERRLARLKQMDNALVVLMIAAPLLQPGVASALWSQGARAVGQV